MPCFWSLAETARVWIIDTKHSLVIAFVAQESPRGILQSHAYSCCPPRDMSPMTRPPEAGCSPPMPRWKPILALMVVTQFSSTMGFSIIFPFLPLYLKELGSTTGLGIEVLSGLVYSMQAVTMTIASPFWGAVADRYGRKMMVVRAGCGGAVVVLLMGFVQNSEQLVFLRAVQGLITGVVAASSALVAAVTPRERTGYAMGLLQLGLWSGVSMGPLVGGVLSDLMGFRATFVVTSILLLLSGLSVWIGVKEPFERSKQVRVGRLGFLEDWRRILSNRQLDFTLLLRFLGAIGLSALDPVFPLFVLALATGPVRAATATGVVVGAASAASTVTSVYLGRLGDRTGHARVALTCGIGAAVFYVCHVLVGHLWQLLLLYSLTGACVGGLLPSLSAMLVENSRRGDEGRVYGIDNSVTSAGRTVGPVLGAACALWFSPRATFVLTGVIFAGASLVGGLTVCRNTRTRPDNRSPVVSERL
jgi:MFS transporter, DHA1 family, multidrug resistance protein